MTMLAQIAAAGGGALPQYIEDVFSTYVYTGNGATQTITNGIDLAGKGGLTWIKNRTGGPYDHMLLDTARGTSKYLNSNTTAAESTNAFQLTSFNSNGFTLGDGNFTNNSAATYASWTFRKQPKFFDVVTWTGNDVNGRTVSHALGSTPGTIIVKCTSDATTWTVYHRSLGATKYLGLEETSAAFTSSLPWNNTEPTSTVFSVGTSTWTNATGRTYVAYLFAHDAGGFGLAGTDNVVSCGSYTGTGAANNNITLGYEPQWVLVKRSSDAGNDWVLLDTMRGMSETGQSFLYPNTAGAEVATSGWIAPTATGFRIVSSGGASLNGSGSTYIYIAIRRGPMKVPTDGTKVFSPVTRTGTGATATGTAGFAPDLMIPVNRPHDIQGATPWFDKLRGANQALYSNNTGAEETRADAFTFSNTGVTFGTNAIANSSGASYINWYFQRAPGFFDEVCYTGTGVARTVAHNLAAVPELMIVKSRSDAAFWPVYSSGTGAGSYSVLNTTAAKANDTGAWDNTTPTASVFSLGNSWVQLNQSAATYVAYLFATCPGVSKVGSYTGTAATQVINCGFAAGARFVLIKRTDSTGDWYVWDSARGIIAGDDPYLLINSSAAEVTNTDYVDTAATGFELTSTAPAAINASGGSYIFLAVA